MRTGKTISLVCRLIVTVVAIVSTASAQGLAEKIDSLNVRKSTSHYRLAGTVTDTRLATYANALEAIYGEYEKGFSELLKTEHTAAERKSAADKRSRKPGSRLVGSDDDDPGGDADSRSDKSSHYPVIIF